MYEVLYRRLKENDAQIAWCGHEVVSEGGYDPAPWGERSGAGVVRVFSGQECVQWMGDDLYCQVFAWDKLFQRSVTDQVRFVEGMRYEDFSFGYNCALRAERVAYMEEPLYCYCDNPESATRIFSANHFDVMRSLEMAMEFYKEHCPQALSSIQARYVDSGLRLMEDSRGVPSVRDAREELAEKLRHFCREHPRLSLRWKAKLRLIAFQMGQPVFDAVTGLYERLRK